MLKKLVFTVGLMAFAMSGQAQSTWNISHLDSVKTQIDRPMYSKAYAALIAEADTMLAAPAGAGSIDNNVEKLSLAWYLSRDNKYAAKATEELKTLLADKNGVSNLSNSKLLNGIALLSSSPAWNKKLDREVRKYMTSSLESMVKGGVKNDQAIATAMYLGKNDAARDMLGSMTKSDLDRCSTETLADMLIMADKLGVDKSKLTNLYGAMDKVAATIPAPRETWRPESVEAARQNTLRDMWRVAMIPGSGRNEYLKIYDSNRIFNPSELFTLTYYTPDDVDDAFANAEYSLRHGVECVNVARKEEGNRRGQRVNPHSIRKDGSLALTHCTEWTSGFFPGELWIMYDFTNNPYWRQQAATFTWPVEDAKNYRGTHDLGFMLGDSFCKGWQITGERSYFDVAHKAAQTLSTRFSPKTGLIRSWDHNTNVWKYPVIIDNMMNLELLFNMSEATGDPTFRNIAVSHADRTMKNHFRPDHSSFHVVDYDPENGDVRKRMTAQGFADNSCWSRGQGWGLYGFTMCYRYTHDPKYLEHAKGIADFILSYENMPSDGVPYWDFMAPGSEVKDNPEVPRDASAGALIATALCELERYVDADRAEKYRKHADKILASLADHYTLAPEDKKGFILDHSTGSFPHNSEVDVPLIYADYYYLQALKRKHENNNK